LEEEDVLTHFGQSLAEMDEFGNDGLGGSDDETGMLDKDMVNQNFGGFEQDVRKFTCSVWISTK
jgi:nucleolar protein 14